ncbi:uncharacterized protein LOC133522292 [Cydia pomonella]|uniref:uncharacterized protein LOC133522292 n=1 Tax=Cydia pomonella TaxID=82600 RepID=UPI002ADE58C4|nr:uncharacterized protein LOC133522292 [Cydia pomonella]
MNTKMLLLIFLRILGEGVIGHIMNPSVDIFDLSHPVLWKDMQNIYEEIATHKQWQVCFNCGFPEMGTAIHYQYYGWNAVKPAAIPIQNLLTRLVVIDLSSITKSDPNHVLTLDDARRWLAVEQGPFQPTLILFKFGWADHPSYGLNYKCFCQMPGIGFDLAAWIAVNLSHVVGVATDAPSLESEETRNGTAKTVSVLLGKSGVYMIENVDARRKLPEKGCMALVSPLKLLDGNFVPTRLTAFCPRRHHDKVEIIMAPRINLPPQ